MRDDALLLDILLNARDARDFVSGMDRKTFLASRLHQNAVIRSLEVIGEASNKLSPEFRKAHPEVPWSDMIGMRHRLIHDYGGVRIDLVWEVAASQLPALIKTIGPMVPPPPPPGGLQGASPGDCNKADTVPSLELAPPGVRDRERQVPRPKKPSSRKKNDWER